MRKKIKQLNRNKKYKFIATISKVNYETILLMDVCLVMDHSYLTDHLWIKANKKTDNLNLKEGNQITFTGNVREYMKINREMDYGISNIANMEVVGKETNKSKKLDFSIIIVYQDSKEIELGRCLNSIRQQSRIKVGKKNSECAEVLVIQDLNSSISKQFKQNYSDICTFLQSESKDWYELLYKGYKESRGKVLLFMKPQHSLENNALKQIYSIIHQKNPNILLFNDSYDAINDGSIEMLDETKKEALLKQNVSLYSKAFTLNAFNALGLPKEDEETIGLTLIKHIKANKICVYHSKLYSER